MPSSWVPSPAHTPPPHIPLDKEGPTLRPYPPANSLCIGHSERAKTNIPRRQLRSYKERSRHLCKVTRAFFIGAQGRSLHVVKRAPAERSIDRLRKCGYWGYLYPYFPPTISQLSTDYPLPIDLLSPAHPQQVLGGWRAIVVSEVVPARRLGQRLGSPQGQRR